MSSSLRCIKNVNLLDEPADALIYSTNVMLNCSGGVGACLMQRYGVQVQKDLHKILAGRGIKFVPRGDIIQQVTEGMPYRRVYHTVPSDGFYDTTPEIVADVLRWALRDSVESGEVSSVVLSAIATGFGHLQFEDFFGIAAPVMTEEEFDSIETITICIDAEFSFRLAREEIEKHRLPLAISA